MFIPSSEYKDEFIEIDLDVVDIFQFHGTNYDGEFYVFSDNGFVFCYCQRVYSMGGRDGWYVYEDGKDKVLLNHFEWQKDGNDLQQHVKMQFINNLPYTFIKYLKLGPGWSIRPYEEILEMVTPEKQVELLFHLDLFA